MSDTTDNTDTNTNTDEPTKAELHDRVQQLESTVEKLMPSRRDALRMGAAGIAGAAGLGAASQSADASTGSAGDIGSSSDRPDLFADEIDANKTAQITTDTIPLTDTSGNTATFNVIYREIGEFAQILTDNQFWERSQVASGQNITVDSNYSLPIPAEQNNRYSCTSTARAAVINTDLILWEIFDGDLHIGRLGDSTDFNDGLSSSLQLTGSQNAIPLTIDLTYRKA